MRIITGLARGKKLAAPSGLKTRPTTDRVKESIFNIVQFDIEGRAVLDLFCGSGQLGLEAVSRGARTCVLVDNDRAAMAAVERNIQSCGFEQQCMARLSDASSFVARQNAQSFGLIFLDPPYGGGVLQRALLEIFRFDILQEGGIIVCESVRAEALPEGDSPYRVLKTYEYGNSKVTTYTREEA